MLSERRGFADAVLQENGLLTRRLQKDATLRPTGTVVLRGLPG